MRYTREARAAVQDPGRHCKGRRSIIPSSAFAVSGLAFLVLVPGTDPRSDPAEGTGRELVEAVCGQCHALSIVTDSRRTREEWERVIDQMIRLGAPLYGDEKQVIVDYLSEHPRDDATAPGASGRDPAAKEP